VRKLLCVIPLIFISTYASADLVLWETNEQAAQLKSSNAMLTVEYNSQSKCSDFFVFLLVIKSKQLGKVISRDFADASKEKNKLNFVINGKTFDYSTEKTLRAIYDDGVEFGVLPPLRLVEELKTNTGDLEVRIGSAPLARFEKTQGLAEALVPAKANCLNKLKK
jgi:hypothetical protein